MADRTLVAAIRGHIEDILVEEAVDFEIVTGLGDGMERLIVTKEGTKRVLAIDIGDTGFHLCVIEEHKPVAFETEPVQNSGGVIVHDNPSAALTSLIIRAVLGVWAEDDRL